MGPAALIVGALVLAAAVGSSGKPTAPKSGTPKALPPGKAMPNTWGILGCDPIHTPSGSKLAARAGVQSHPDYQWCYAIRDGDDPGGVAALVLGPDQAWRYVELLTANPEMATKGSVIAPDAGDAEMNFVPSEWKVGRVIRLPRTWNPWIDQLGSPREETAPYMPAGYLS